MRKLILMLCAFEVLSLKAKADVSYDFDEETGVLTISGDGVAGNGGYKNMTSVVIEKGITSIGYRAFFGMPLESITIPSSVTSIGDDAFRGTKLKTLTVPDTVTSAVSCSGCQALTEVSIGKNVSALGSFQGSHLTTINIPEDSKITSIGYRAFWDTPLESITIPNSVTSIGDDAFHGTKLKTLTVPDTVTSAVSCSMCSELTEATIGKNVSSIGSFRGSHLTTINIPEDSKITSIGYRAFFGTPLESITIPSLVTSIGVDAFWGCKNLKTLVIPDGVSISSNAFVGVQVSDISVSATQLEAYLNAGGGLLPTDKLKIKCMGGNCKEVLSSFGGGKYASYAANVIYGSVVNKDGSVTLFDENGNVSGYRNKRIYTIEEASKISKPTGNTFKLRYK